MTRVTEWNPMAQNFVRPTLAEFLLARIAEDEQWAHEASRRDEHYAEGGACWQWVYSTGDEVARVDPAAGEHLNNAGGRDWDSVSLRSVQEFPTMSVGPLPQFAIGSVYEVATTVAGHIARGAGGTSTSGHV